MAPFDRHLTRSPLPAHEHLAESFSSSPSPPAVALCGFVPPYLLRHLAAQEHPTITAHEHPCGQTLAIDAGFRERRQQAGTHTPTAPSAVAVVDEGDRWVIHSAGNEETLPGTVARSEGDPAVDDVAVDEAYAWTQQVWDLYEQQFDRRSFDGVGSTVTVTVHYGQNYDNAFWDGEQLVFGDGDGEIFERFTKPADVLAHEFSHGVVQYTSAFSYSGQPGALNESIADVFASMSIQHAAGQTADQASWLIGEGLFKPGINAKALRSMLEPGTAYDDPQLGQDPQVGSMADYVDTTEDNGGVHLNSGIPNRAFALAATGVGGHSWEQVGRVWYEALTSDEVGAETDFVGFAVATVAAATQLPDPAVADHVRAAWVEVGVLQASAPVDVLGAEPATQSQGRPESAPGSRGSGDAGSQEPTTDLIMDRAQTVAVRRSGGFTGQIRSAEIELGQDDERAAEVRRLLRRVDLQQVSSSADAPDRFVYTVEVGDRSITLGERDLTPDLQRVVQLVLGTGQAGLPDGGRDLA
ncbi:MAG TPA: protealysin inhibitor emfourin [Microlunatus sp.]|nr:protealysin inhibitor emfourin [Microlunatus sp.]